MKSALAMVMACGLWLVAKGDKVIDLF